jgi:hypothetical protein
MKNEKENKFPKEVKISRLLVTTHSKVGNFPFLNQIAISFLSKDSI